MSARWYFASVGNTVHLQARMEGPRGLVAHAYAIVEADQSFLGLPFAVLKQAENGTVTYRRGEWRLDD